MSPETPVYSPLSSNKSSIGDILLTFREPRPDFARRTLNAAWQNVLNGPSWQLWEQPNDPHWGGFPLRTIQIRAWTIWLLGELYETSDLFSTPENIPAEIDLAAKISRLNGHFLILAWQQDTRQWHTWTDRFGTLHAYYASSDQRAALGTFFPTVASAASHRQLDWEALASFFACGFFPHQRTYYNDVQILLPATHYIFNEKGHLLNQERYWQWFHSPNLHRTYQDTVIEFKELFQQVMHDLTSQGQVAMPISGGLDSRSTVAAVSTPEAQPDPRFWFYSYGYAEDSVETRIARRIAAARHLPFQPFTIRPYLFDKLDLCLSCVEGFQDLTMARQASVIETVGEHATHLIAAHMGDLWCDNMGLAGHAPSSEQALIEKGYRKMRKGGSQWLFEHFQPLAAASDEVQAMILNPIAADLATSSHIEDADFRIKILKVNQWVFRWTNASLRMFQATVFPRLPFYDTRLADFFCTTPTHFVSGRRLQIDYLKRFAPDLARITWQVYDANLFNYQHFNTWLLPRRALKKAWRALRGQKVLERNWEVQFLNPAGRAGLERWLLGEERNGRKLRLHEFVSPRAVQELLDTFYAAPLEQGRGYTLSMLLTFSAWLEYLG